MIGPWLQLGNDAKIGAEETAPDLGHQLFPRPVRATLVVAAEIAANAISLRRPVDMLVTEDGRVRGRVAERPEWRHLDVRSPANNMPGPRHDG